MSNYNKILITGLLGLLASILVGAGEFFLHYSPQIIGHAENYQFFIYVPNNHLTIGHFLAVVGIPFYFVGYYHIYLMLKKGNKILAKLVFILGVLAFLIGGFWITSRAFLGNVVQLQNDMPQATYQLLLEKYTLISESLVQALRVIVFLLSICFVLAILKGGTYYKKWMVFFNPIVLLLLVFVVYFISPTVGKYSAPIAMNVVHFILFSLSLYQLKFTKNKL
jgi:hypothetical protein